MKSRLIAALTLGLGMGLLGLLFSLLMFVQEIEDDVGLGLLFSLRGVRTPPSDAVVVSIDSASSEQLKISEEPDRWPRSLHARLIEKLVRAGAKVIVFDVHFIEPKSARDDAMLADAIASAGRVILSEPMMTKGIVIGKGAKAHVRQDSEHSIVRIQKPYAPFEQASLATAPFVLPKVPFKVTQFWTFHPGAGDAPTTPVVAFQLNAMSVYADFVSRLREVNPDRATGLPADGAKALSDRGLGGLVRDLRSSLEVDSTAAQAMLAKLKQDALSREPDNRRRLLQAMLRLYSGPNSRYLNFYGPARTITTVAFHSALDAAAPASAAEQGVFRDKVVFVGLSENLQADSKDSFYTVFARRDGVYLAGVEIAATAFLNLMDGTSLEPLSNQQVWMLLLMVGLVIGAISLISSVTMGGLICIVLSMGYLFVAHQAFDGGGIWYPIVVPLFLQVPLGFLSGVFWNYLRTRREQHRMKTAFARYVPDAVVNQLARNRGNMSHGGKTVYGACLFADVAGYTTLSETMAPQALSELMNRYFEIAFAPVKKHGGLVVDLVGDSFLAIWTAERDDVDVRRRACLAAIDISRAVDGFNATLDNVKLPTRIGVHCGEVFLGNVGAADHYEYHPAGDTVNTASRMDGLNKFLGTKTLVSGDTLAQVDAVASRDLGVFKLKGKIQPLVVHELIGYAESLEPAQERRRAQFNEALSAFHRQEWRVAADLFHTLQESLGRDGPSEFFQNLCEQYEASPPPQPWDRVVALMEK